MRHLLSPDQIDVRARMGCDRPAEKPVFTITCTRCEGSLFLANGLRCPDCKGGPFPGQEVVHRCPRSHYTGAIGDALGAMSWAKAGTMPVKGGMVEQSSSFLEFCQVFEGEVSAVRAEKLEEQRAKAKRGK